jgi:hypothetical protein
MELQLDDYRRYGRQMILDGFGLPGRLCIQPCEKMINDTGWRPTEVATGVRDRCRRRRTWLCCSAASCGHGYWYAIQKSARYIQLILSLDQGESELLTTMLSSCRIFSDKSFTMTTQSGAARRRRLRRQLRGNAILRSISCAYFSSTESIPEYRSMLSLKCSCRPIPFNF